jgi:prephenate dehydratase
MAKNNVWRIGFQGTKRGSFTYAALQEYMLASFPDRDWHAVEFNTFDDVVSAFNADQKITQMFLGTFNNYSGSVQAMAQLMPNLNGRIVGEHFLPVAQHLLVKDGTAIEKIRTAISQKPALDQCRGVIDQFGWGVEEYMDTALAAKMVGRSRRNDIAAIASAAAGKQFGLTDLGVISERGNRTRFLHIVHPRTYGQFPQLFEENAKVITTVIIEGCFLENPDNLGAIQSRGIAIRRFETLPSGGFVPERFVLDLFCPPQAYRGLAKDLGGRALNIRSIGTYKPAELAL